MRVSHPQVAFCGGDARLLAMHGRWDCIRKCHEEASDLRESLRVIKSYKIIS